MMRLRDAPIRRKLITVILLTTVLVMIGTRAAFFSYELLNYRRAIMQQVAVLAEVIASNSTGALAFNDPDDAAEILSAVRAERTISGAALYDVAGNLFSHYPATLAPGDLPAAPGPVGFRFHGTRLAGFQPVVQGGKTLGTLYLQLDGGVLLRTWIQGTLTLTAVIMSIALGLAYLVSRALQHRISRPILELAGTARQVSERGDFSVRAVKHGEDEIGVLTDALNKMLHEIEEQHREIHGLNHELERRVAERTVQLEAANKELEAFSYSVSHDLRAPLRHIDGFAQMLVKRLDGRLDATEQRYFGTIIGSTRGLGMLIDELLAFSRMGRKELCHSRVPMAELVADVRREFESDCAGRRVEWHVPNLPVVEADASMLRQVWRNLIGNAIKYSRGRDPAVIGVQHRTIGGEHVFSVSDNGAGFDMQYVHKLFGVFQRLHTEAEFEGTGIGLANVHRIIARHGGRTWAEGTVDRGAVFYFSLPVTLTTPAHES